MLIYYRKYFTVDTPRYLFIHSFIHLFGIMAEIGNGRHEVIFLAMEKRHVSPYCSDRILGLPQLRIQYGRFLARG